MRLLIVDDTPALRQLVKMGIETDPIDDLRWEIREAANGREALQAARARPHAILLDVRMPGMDGYDVARHIRADESTYGKPVVVFMTAYGDKGETEERARQAGADGYLTKPFDMSLGQVQQMLVEKCRNSQRVV
jgi:CheY-like chemotaxis protein